MDDLIEMFETTDAIGVKKGKVVTPEKKGGRLTEELEDQVMSMKAEINTLTLDL